MRLTERGIEKAPTSSEPWEDIFETVQFPEDIRGLRILDVGAGASDAVAHLLELGADAYAIDPIFKSRADLKGKARNNNRLLPFSKEQRMRRNNALESFMDSLKDQPERYRTASATQIPFRDNFFDIVYSISAVLGYLDLDREVLLKGVSECLRVAKPGGRVVFAPYLARPLFPGPVNDLRIDNEKQMIKWLNGDPKVQHITERGEELYRILEIVKSPFFTN